MPTVPSRRFRVLRKLYPAHLAVLLLVALSATAEAGRPAANLLPQTTKGYLSVPDVQLLREAWPKTQLGQLCDDPAVRPFVDDIARRLGQSSGETHHRLALAVDELQNISGGELCLAALEPDGENTHAIAVLADTSGRAAATSELLEKAYRELAQRGGQRLVRAIHGREVVSYSFSDARTGVAWQAHFAHHDNLLLATDHEHVARDILARWNEQQPQGSLAELSAFQQVQQRTNLGAEIQPHIRWFVEPFGYARFLRVTTLAQRQRGTDMLKVVELEGFGNIAGVGGQVALRTQDHELLHRTLIYLPAPKQRAARMLDFPNGSNLNPQPWIPNSIGNYVSFSWKMGEAFEHSKTMIDALAGEGFFEEFLDDLQNEPNGPRINLRKDLVRHLGHRVTFISDTQQPITPQSERFLVAVEVTDGPAVARAINQALRADPTAKERNLDGLFVWEITSEQVDDPDLNLTVEVEEPGFQFGGPVNPVQPAQEPAPALPQSAIAVIDGMLIVSSHADFIAQVVRPQTDVLQTNGADYGRVAEALQRLGAGQESFRIFSRSDETYRATYELIRQGRVNESQSLLARLLNRFHGESAGARRQELDGSKLPEFAHVQKYLGPAGVFVDSHSDGWTISGCLLSQPAR
jgi:hypothetical protein